MANQSSPIIKFEDVWKIYSHNSIALEAVSFTIDKGEFVSIVGASGAGKSTVLKLITMEEMPSRGRIIFNGYNLSSLTDREKTFHRRRLGAIFQDFKLLPKKTVFENVAFALEVSGAPNREIKKRVPEILEIVGLGGKKDSFPDEISGGEQQRTAIARALVAKPLVLLADEPTGNLDPKNSWEIVDLLLKINLLGTTIILATHNKEIVDNLKKRVLTLEKGMIVSDQKVGRYRI